MTTQGFIPKSELLDWLRRSVWRRENVVLKIVTDPRRYTITLRLSGGRLVYVDCEGHGPLDALVLLAESEQVRFTFSSAPAIERRELMSSKAFLRWLDTAGVGEARNGGIGGMSRASEGRPWSGALRGGPSGRGSAGVAAAVVVVIAVVGLILAGTVLDGGAGEAQWEPTAGGSSTKIEESGAVLVRGPIVETTTWKTGRTYRLDGLVFVEAGARLLVEPGVTVLGGPGAALIVTRDASIHARGTEDEPIVFTSARPEGSRASGDWGGVVLLGNAPLNRERANVEGIPRNDGRGIFGGKDRRSNCGVLEYVRIEFAGYPIGADNELNGLTLGGCGSETLVRHVQTNGATSRRRRPTPLWAHRWRSGPRPGVRPIRTSHPSPPISAPGASGHHPPMRSSGTKRRATTARCPTAARRAGWTDGPPSRKAERPNRRPRRQRGCAGPTRHARRHRAGDGISRAAASHLNAPCEGREIAVEAGREPHEARLERRKPVGQRESGVA